MSQPRIQEPIVADGRQRLQREVHEEVRKAVMRQYEPELATVGPFKRLYLRLKMQREIRREAETLAPGDALYLRVEREKEQKRAG